MIKKAVFFDEIYGTVLELYLDKKLNCRGHLDYIPKTGYYLLKINGNLNRDDRLQTLLHEIIHYCISVFNYVNIDISEEKDEAFAYFYEYAISKLIKKI